MIHVVVPRIVFSNYHNDILFTTVNVLKLRWPACNLELCTIYVAFIMLIVVSFWQNLSYICIFVLLCFLILHRLCWCTQWRQHVSANRRPVMLVGGAGCGKTVLINNKLQSLGEDMMVTMIPFNYYTTSLMLQQIMEKPLTREESRSKLRLQSPRHQETS